MKNWYMMQPPNFYRGYELEDFEAYAQEGFEELLLSSPLSTHITIFNDTELHDGFVTQAIVQNVTSDSTNNDTTRQVLCRIGTLKSGQYVEYKNRYWLVVSLPDDNAIYEKAIMLCCNHYLQWINPEGDIVGRYAIVSDETKYTMGTKNNRDYMLVLGETRMNIMVPRDLESLRLKRGRRFLISNSYQNPIAYIITKFDDVSEYYVSKDVMPFTNYDGIIRAICVETQFNPLTDNQERMIADYYPATEPPEETEPPDPVPDAPHIQITDPLGDFRISIGDVRTVEVCAYVGGQKLDTMLECELVRAAGIARIKSTSIGSITIQAEGVVGNVGKTFLLRIWNTEYSLEAEQEFTIVGLMG